MFDWSIPVCCHLVQYPGEGDPDMTAWRTHPPSSKLRNIPSRCLFDQLSALGACLHQHSTPARTGDSVQKITLRLLRWSAKNLASNLQPLWTILLSSLIRMVDSKKRQDHQWQHTYTRSWSVRSYFIGLSVNVNCLECGSNVLSNSCLL